MGIAVMLESACVAFPTFSEQWRTGGHEGLILDDATSKPIEGAKVHIQFHSTTSAMSDERGRFTVGPILMHVKTLLLLAPSEQACIDVLKIEHPDYETVDVTASSAIDRKGSCENVNFHHEIRMKKTTLNSKLNGETRKASAHRSTRLQS